MSASYPLPLVNAYLAAKGHLLPASASGDGDVGQTTRDLVALHSTLPKVPFLSLWARMPGFARGQLERALYDERSLARLICMRDSLFVVPSEEFPYFFNAYSRRANAHARREDWLLVAAGLCAEGEARDLADRLQRRVLEVMADGQGRTAEEVVRLIPELGAKVRLSEGLPYEATVTVGSRFVQGLSAYGLIVRARNRGTWRSYTWEYASLSGWLPGLDLASVGKDEAQAWLVRRYLAAFGPATFEDVRWWTGLGKGEVARALGAAGDEVVTVNVAGLSEEYLMLAGDEERLAAFASPEEPYVFLLPALDPYIMGYRLRERFLRPEYRTRTFDNVGNARPTIWANGRVVGAWRETVGKPVQYEVFEPLTPAEQSLLKDRQVDLTRFLAEP